MIFLAVLICYLPAIGGGFIWDDDDYVTGNPNLNSLAGLWRIWFKLGATPQYYPLVFTSFWIEHHLWGLHPLGYHLVNVSLHAGSAVLLWTVLDRLRVPGAWLAGLIFALHPVGVESVAWITERKNVLSAFCYLLAWLPLIRVFRLDKPPDTAATGGVPAPPETEFAWTPYCLALGLFACAMLSKTVTCSLPVAIPIVLWWKRGRVRMGDLIPLTPFFAIGAGMGLTTAWMERQVVGAQGVDWTLSFLERVLVAGRAIWFYLGKLIWPANLTFIYPRWQIDSGRWWQYLFPLGAGALLLALWLWRGKIGRGALAAALFFVVTLAPALGFIDFYPMRFSFVADHFQYLAMIGPLALAGALGATALHRLPARHRQRGLACLGVLLAAVLGPQTWRQGHQYKDLETLWRSNLAQNPKSWLALNNLGFLLENRGLKDQAMDYYQQALRENPNWADSHLNLANALLARDQFDEAQVHYAEAYHLKPNDPVIPYNYGVFFVRLNRWKEAGDEFKKALALNPDYADAHYNLGAVLVCLGQPEEAIEHYQRALQLFGGNNPQHLSSFAVAYARAGRFDEAVHMAQQAVDLARSSNDLPLAQAIQERLLLYRAHRIE